MSGTGKATKERGLNATNSTRASVNGTPMNSTKIFHHFGSLKLNHRPSEDKTTAYGSAIRPSDVSKANLYGNVSHYRIESSKNNSFSSKAADQSILQQAQGMQRPSKGRHAAAHEPKTSSYLQRYKQNNDNNQFWADIRLLATHQNKIETIDAKIAQERGLPTEPVERTTLYTTAQTPRSSSNLRGRGGISKQMYGVEQRKPGGTENPEHVLAGKAMADIIIPPTDPMTRRSMSVQMYTRASEQIGTNNRLFRVEAPVDPATTLRPDKNFRKASVASERGLWIEEKDMDLLTEKQLTRQEVCKA